MWPAFLFTFFHFGKFRDAVLIGAPEKILALGQILGMDFIGEEVDHVAQLVLIQIRRSIVLRQYAFQLRVLLLDGFHRVVDDFTDFLRMAGRGDHAPAGTFRHVENVLLRISVPVIFIVLPFCDEFLIAFFKRG